ncbi:hypothetical protein LZP69_03625 [Shewanella sp. AS1]|uniref:hypothetical protein n=1 Tax=Shewanella sp. AS1 TaxID=2907626 RepID=UPI001F3639B4|nr:hypothetical protein [Shewanella sp. AS1]MCE9678285.1 hypothetical protein [Shewanella sp. AS1]
MNRVKLTSRSSLASASIKPDRRTAMLRLMAQVREALPLTEPETFICGPKGDCIGCSKKLLELIDSELSYWQAALDNGEVPQLGEISRFAKLAKNVHRALVRSGVIARYQAKYQES